MSKCFQIMLQNIRSLTKNFDDLQVLLESLSEKSSAICLTETWLKEYHHTKSMFLGGYRPLVNSNRKKRGGGVAIFIKKSLQAKVVNSCNLNGPQALTIRVTGTVETAIYVTCMYLPPNSVNAEALSKIESYFDSLMIEPQSYNIVCGDFDINFLKNNQKRETLKEIMKGCCMIIIDENSNTQETACSKSNLDIFFCIFTAELKVKKTCICDHYSVCLGFQTGTQMENKLENITSRKWQKIKDISLIEKINFVLSHEISKLENCEKYKTIDNKFEELQILLKSILNRYLPKQVVNQPWLITN